MQDRVPLYPGRVQLVPVADQPGVYDMTRADDPTQEGTPLSKATLLQDATEESIFGEADNRTVDDAFMGISVKLNTTIDDVATLNTKVDLIMNDVASITVTLKDSAGTAIPGVLVQGILSESGQAVYSSDSGVVSGYISEGSQTIKVTGYADIADYSETLSVTKGTSITKTITLTTRNFLKITSSQNVKFSGNVETVDVTVVGGGGGGGCGGSNYLHYATYDCGSGAGGGSGYFTAGTGIDVIANTNYPAIIGAGGVGSNSSANAGANGGSTSFLGVTANGGNGGNSANGISIAIGGSGGVSGANGVISWANYGAKAVGNDGSSGLSGFFDSFSSTTIVAGSGASGSASSNYGRIDSGGAAKDGGGNGGPALSSNNQNMGTNGTSGTGGGGGGGGVRLYVEREDGEIMDVNVYTGSGGSGGSGCVAIRMHLRSAA